MIVNLSWSLTLGPSTHLPDTQSNSSNLAIRCFERSGSLRGIIRTQEEDWSEELPKQTKFPGSLNWTAVTWDLLVTRLSNPPYAPLPFRGARDEFATWTLSPSRPRKEA